MSKTYELELKVILTDEQQQTVLQAARRIYAAGAPSIRYEGETSRELSLEELIDGPESALVYIIEQNAGMPALTHLSVGRRKIVRRQWLNQWMERNKAS